MAKKKKEKLVIIGPTGKRVEIGFLSQCKDGWVIGTPRINGEPVSHLTILNKSGEISSHITPQQGSGERQRFPPLKTDELAARFQSLVDKGIVRELPEQEQSEKVFYVGQKMLDWFSRFMEAVYQIEQAGKETIHVINVKKALEALPELVEELKDPANFGGFCQAHELVSDKSKVAGITESKKFILPVEDTLLSIDVNAFIGLNLFDSPVPTQLNTPLGDFYQSLGLPQYIDQEVVRKRYLEQLLGNEKIDNENRKSMKNGKRE